MDVNDLILAELKSLRTDLREHRAEVASLRKCITSIKVQLEGLKVRSTLWGAMAGGIPALGVLAWTIYKTIQ